MSYTDYVVAVDAVHAGANWRALVMAALMASGEGEALRLEAAFPEVADEYRIRLASGGHIVSGYCGAGQCKECPGVRPLASYNADCEHGCHRPARIAEAVDGRGDAQPVPEPPAAAPDELRLGPRVIQLGHRGVL